MVEDVQGSVTGTGSFLDAGSESCCPGDWSSIKENSDLQVPRLSSENEALEMVFSKRLCSSKYRLCSSLVLPWFWCILGSMRSVDPALKLAPC